MGIYGPYDLDTPLRFGMWKGATIKQMLSYNEDRALSWIEWAQVHTDFHLTKDAKDYIDEVISIIQDALAQDDWGDSMPH